MTMPVDGFEWAGPARMVFGAGTLEKLAACCADFGRRVMLVCGANSRSARVESLLQRAGFRVVHHVVAGEPTVAWVAAAVELARVENCEWVLGFGGGSALDAGKAVAALLPQSGGVLDYLEVVGKGRALDSPAAPFVAVPTTAGTGAEATRNAVLLSPEHGVKASLRHASMLPRLALIDPELALSLPPALTAATGMDALTQLLEAYVCTRANAMTDALCAQAIPRAVLALPRAVADGSDLGARSELALAALYSGLALANAGLGAVHGFAAPLGGRCGIAHGAVCAALLPAVWSVNLEAVRARGSVETLERFRQAAVWLSGDEGASPETGVTALRALSGRLNIAGLRTLGVAPAQWDELIPLAQRASSMKANPLSLTEAELRACLERASA